MKENTDLITNMTEEEFDSLVERLAEVKATDDGRVRRTVYAYAAKKAKRQRRTRFLRRAVAAGVAAALLTGVSVVWFNVMRRTGVEGSEFAPASSYAMLITDTGGSFELSDRDTTIVAGGANMVIRNGELIFGEGSAAHGAAEGNTQNRIVVPRGGIYTVWLPDSTKVILNSDSELAFPSAFADGERAVTLRGEGYFEVARDTRRPFTVDAGDDVNIRVLGTKFNVQAYADIPQTQVTLVEGSVGVRCKEADVTLEPDQQALFDRVSGSFFVSPVADAAVATAWTRGYFDFEAAPLGVIIKSLEKWYDADISAEGIDLDALGIFSLRMSRRGDIVPVLNTLHDITGLNYRMDGRTIYLSF